MSLDQNTWGIQPGFADIDNCQQPKFIQISLDQAIPSPQAETARFVDFDIDLSQMTEQKKIDFFQGFYGRFYTWQENDIAYTSPPNGDAVPPWPANASYELIFDNGYKIACDGINGGTGGFEVWRPLNVNNPVRLKLRMYAIDDPAQSTFPQLSFIRCDLYFSNYRVRPYDSAIGRPLQQVA